MDDNLDELDLLSSEKAKERNRPREEILNDVAKVMKTPEGRRFVWAILSLCELAGKTTFRDPYLTVAASARKDVGMDMLDLLERCDPTLYPKLILEMQDATGK